MSTLGPPASITTKMAPPKLSSPRIMSQPGPAAAKLARSSSRMSSASRDSSDEDQGKTAVRVGKS